MSSKEKAGMVYGSLPTSEEQKQNLERIKQAQDYLASHRIKELFSKLIYELIVHRPNQAYPALVDRLKQIKEFGMEATTSPKPRLIGIITDTKEDFEIHQAIKHIATDMNMKM
ncbi:predicted protein [Naegleria gruberi]|uniref:Predicted protein n=1 Tax=Naegleria gruberi TaxID=5762 RepID=D2V3H3_NAEGR|nr:uncharacterized protein NAEGRDRAFT_63363 [Naegleria gruberi]EFC48771.1 predicted protein [Naegleria gruberi]|eukprot:XP_002681515.1 predicted protein [Naegleria gruberi strain NEG-M]